MFFLRPVHRYIVPCFPHVCTGFPPSSQKFSLLTNCVCRLNQGTKQPLVVWREAKPRRKFFKQHNDLNQESQVLQEKRESELNKTDYVYDEGEFSDTDEGHWCN